MGLYPLQMFLSLKAGIIYQKRAISENDQITHVANVKLAVKESHLKKKRAIYSILIKYCNFKHFFPLKIAMLYENRLILCYL